MKNIRDKWAGNVNLYSNTHESYAASVRSMVIVAGLCFKWHILYNLSAPRGKEPQ